MFLRTGCERGSEKTCFLFLTHTELFGELGAVVRFPHASENFRGKSCVLETCNPSLTFVHANLSRAAICLLLQYLNRFFWVTEVRYV